MKKLLLIITAFTVYNLSLCQVHLTAGLVGYFKFSNSLLDSTGNMVPTTGVNIGYATDACGHSDSALRCFSTNAYDGINTNGYLSFSTTGSFSYVTQFNSSASQTQSFYSDYSAANGWSLGFLNSSVGTVSFCGGGTDTINVSTINSFNDGLWHEAILIVNRSTELITIYVDGVLQNLTNNTSNGTIVGGNELNITGTGMNANPSTFTRIGQYFIGDLDEMRFYNRVLDTNEVSALQNLTLCTLTGEVSTTPKTSFEVYPNPSNGIFTLELSHPEFISESVVINIYNELGKLVYSQFNNLSRSNFGIQHSTFSIDLSNQPSGVYLYRIISGDGSLAGEGKFILNK